MVASIFTVGLMGLFGSWNNLMFFCGIASLIMAVIWFVIYRDNPTGPMPDTKNESFFQPLIKALKLKVVWLFGIGWIGTTLVWIAFTSFWPTYAIETYGMDIETAGWLIGVIPIASVIACLTSTKIAYWLGHDKWMIWPWGFILPFAYYFTLRTSSVPLLVILFFIAGYGAFAFGPIAITTLFKIPNVEPSVTATGLGFVFTLSSIGGTLAGVIIGALTSSMSLYMTMAICCASPFLWGILTLFIPEYGRIATEKAAKEKAAQQ